MTTDFQELLPDLQQLDKIMPQMAALMRPNIETMKSMRTMMLQMHSSQAGMQDQMKARDENSTAMGDAFNDSMNDDTFYLPPEIFDNEEFKRGMDSFISPERPRGPVHRLPRGRSADLRRHRPHRRHQAGGQGSHQGHAARRVQDLRRRNRLGVQGHAGGQQLRPADRRNLRADTDLHHHAAHHAQPRRRGRHRRHRGAVARRVVRPVGSGVAAHPRHRTALHGDGDGGHHPVGRRRGLQPVVGGAPQGGDSTPASTPGSSAPWAAAAPS